MSEPKYTLGPSYDDKFDGLTDKARIDELEGQLVEQSALYDKAFSDSGGLLHRKELVRMVNERDAQLAALRDASETYIKICRHHKTCWAEIAAVYNGPKPQCSCGYDKLAALLQEEK